jgi:catechol 2,3-dioxygenase-like lactoylglutathione lyase family enzyme
MTVLKLTIGACILSAATMALAQDGGVQVWGVRVLATDAEAIAAFYEKTFGMSEVARPVNSATTKEILLNFGQTPDIARRAATTPIVIYTRPATAPAGAMASLLLRVPDLDKAIEAVKANGGKATRPPGRNAVVNVTYAFVTDPDGNQIELIVDTK